MAVRRVVILGSTGSIGRQSLEVAREFGAQLQVVGLAAGSSVELLLSQAREFRPEAVSLAQGDLAQHASKHLSRLGVEVLAGSDAAARLLEETRPDIVVSAMVGAAGLLPTCRALEMGIDVALANKETLVAAGGHVMDLAVRSGAELIPVDSEHSALFQCLGGREASDLRYIWLTASGGPFLRRSAESLASVSPEEAVNHPRWDMGRKISVDSATLMNKGLEVIEACWLFGVGPERVKVVVHPQSTVHSMVEFEDGSLLAHLGPTDMRLAIQYAFSHPRRWRSPWSGGFDPRSMEALEFEAPDEERFPCLRLAYRAARIGGTLPAVLNAANEVAVERFLERHLRFTDIWHLVEDIMDSHQLIGDPSLDEVLAADEWARHRAGEWRSES